MDANYKAHPMYRLLPWEIEHADALTKSSTLCANEEFEYNWTPDKIQKKIQSATVGFRGEIAFMQMLLEKHQEVIKWTTDEKTYTKYFDFDLENCFGKVDVKASNKSLKISTPQATNFIIGENVMTMYADGSKKMPDYFVQLWIDNDVAVYVGALSRFLLEKYINGEEAGRLWNGRLIINRKKFDATDIFLPYFKDSSKVNYTDLVF